jgi:hypothetical protein
MGARLCTMTEASMGIVDTSSQPRCLSTYSKDNDLNPWKDRSSRKGVVADGGGLLNTSERGESDKHQTEFRTWTTTSCGVDQHVTVLNRNTRGKSRRPRCQSGE